ncbi:MAG: hypothetical protein C0500_08400 [Sphingobium sp.]|nr:hypothetical protein [Sphingobium sp.]
MITDQGFDQRFRPLLSATIGSGLVALALLDFAANGWDSFGAPGRVMIAVAARTAFLMFALSTLALLAAYLASAVIGPAMTVILNLYGAGIFLVGTFLTGGLLSRAFELTAPGADNPPEAVKAFIGFAGIGLLILVMAVVFALIVRLATGASRHPNTVEGGDGEA